MRKRFRLLFPILVLVSFCVTAISSMPVSANKYSTFKWASVKQVEITAYSLNVRTGPGISYPVVSRLKKGQIVNVLGSLNDWYIVHLPNDSIGVITNKFTKAYTYNSAKEDSVETNTIPTLATSNDDMAQKEEIMLDYINIERNQLGLPSYVMDMELSNIASIKAKDMAENNYFSHISPTHGTPFEMMKQFGISYKIAGENIAAHSSVKNAHDSFMGSPGHKANVLNKNYDKIGIGIAPDKKYGYIYVQLFKK
ncbi:MAG: SH3 domain-containing protein [Epulopiscium sp.]|nr:SH3 domain-containing protein [Candidatus Epulonipiscium sp.]